MAKFVKLTETIGDSPESFYLNIDKIVSMKQVDKHNKNYTEIVCVNNDFYTCFETPNEIGRLIEESNIE